MSLEVGKNTTTLSHK